MTTRWPRPDRRSAVSPLPSPDQNRPDDQDKLDGPSDENASAPSSPKRTPRRPLHERTSSQNNRLSGIRIVPYSPVRLISDDAPGSSHVETEATDKLDKPDNLDNLDKDKKRHSRANRASWGSLIAATAAAAGLTSPTASSGSKETSHSNDSKDSNSKDSNRTVGKAGHGSGWLGTELWGRNEERLPPLADIRPRDVSSPEPISPTDRWPGPDATSVRPATPLRSVHGAVQDDAENSSSLEEERLERLDRLATLAMAPAPLVLTSTGFRPSSPSSPAASVTSFVSASSSQTHAFVPRPSSRRGNVIAVHADKTFSLVPRHMSIASASTTAPSIPLPPLSYTSSSQDRFLSDTFSLPGDRLSRPSSRDRTRTNSLSLSLFPAPSSPDRDRDFSNQTDFSAWDYRASVVLRKVPQTPDRKQKGRSISPTRSAVSAASGASLSSALYLHQLHDATARDISTTWLPPLLESSPRVSADIVRPDAPATDPRLPIRKVSDNSDHSSNSLSASFSASTLSATTNYKVYSRSSPPLPSVPPPDDHTPSPIDSIGSIGSSLGTFGNTTNVEILGRSSPPHPDPEPVDLPVLRRSLNPEETFTTLSTASSYDDDENDDSSDKTHEAGLTLPAPSGVRLPSSRPPVFRPRSADADTDFSEPNYVLHGEPSVASITSVASLPQAPPSTSSSAVSSHLAIARLPFPDFSQESLVVPPLQPSRKRSYSGSGSGSLGSRSRSRSNERFGYYKSRSRESLRHAASLKSISSVILNQEAASTFFAGQAFLNLHFAPVPVFTAQPRGRSPAAAITKAVPKRKPVPSLLVTLPTPIENKVLEQTSPNWQKLGTMQEYPHQWSSQLSTVLSESEEADSIDSRVVSAGHSNSISTRRSSAVGRVPSSTHSRNMPSISSSLALQIEESRAAHASRSDSMLLERAQPAYVVRHSRSPSASPPASALLRSPVVRDVDEHGDGLADLEARPVPSRSGLAGFFHGSSSSSSSNNINRDSTHSTHSTASNHRRSTHSTSSSRGLHTSASARSLTGIIPQWARVYYGSGERKWLAAANASQSDLGSLAGDDSRPTSRILRAPAGYFYNARRRPRDSQGRPVDVADGADAADRPLSNATSIIEMGGPVDPAAPPPARGLRTMASSVWSPHLRIDRRAARFSMWDPPSMAWSTETSMLDRRNRQVVAFVVGFAFPLAWILAAFLPVPADPERALEKRPEADSEIGIPAALERRLALADEARYQSACWWRKLNRIFSVVGLLVIAAVIALAVVGTKQGWGQ